MKGSFPRLLWVFLLSWLPTLAALPAAETSIAGKLTSGPRRGELILQRLDRQRYEHEEVARSTLVAGEVSLVFEQQAAGLYRLRLPKGKRLDLALRPGQQLTFEYDPESRSFSSTGSPDTAAFRAGIRFDREYSRAALNAAVDRLAAARKRRDATAVADAEEAVQRERRAWFDDFVAWMATVESPLAVYGLFTLYDWNYQIGDYDLAGIEAIHRRFVDDLEPSPEIDLLGDLIGRYRLTAVGSILPDHPLPDTNGKIVQISDLRGRYVLVDIWASWCVPCRKESPNLVANYRKYKDSGFTIYSISFDDERARWLKAIKKDGLDWPYHVSDLKGSHSEATYVYATAPPSYFLLDPEGTILAKNLHGEALSRALREIFDH